MAYKSDEGLKQIFTEGAEPTANDFAALIDSKRSVGKKIPGIDIEGWESVTSGYTGEAKVTDLSAPAIGFHKFSVSTAGTYTNYKDISLNPLVVTSYPEGHASYPGDLERGNVEFWGTDGVWKKVVLSGNLNKYATKAELGLTPISIVESDPTLCTGVPANVVTTFIYNQAILPGYAVQKLRMWCVTAGSIIIGEYQKVGPNIQRVQVALVPVVLGMNEFIVPWVPVVGNYFGYGFNTGGALGRLGLLTSPSPYSTYVYGVGVLSLVALPAPNSTYRHGFSVLFANESTIEYRVSHAEEAINTIATLSKKVGNFNTPGSWSSLSRYEKKLTKIVILGDSLMANATGGTIPSVEPTAESPIRLGQSNNVARRIYDLLSWNKPLWRRLDHVSWTKSGTWSAINTTSIFEPIYPSERYTISSTTGNFVEITVPNGYENFALVLRKSINSGIIDITINGGAVPGGVGVGTFNTLSATMGGTGNPYHILEFKGLSAGSNVIRITHSASSAFPVYIWGGFYWSGNTMVVLNAAHGGHTLAELISDGHVQGEVVDNAPDAVLFELTLMNDTGSLTLSGGSIAASVAALNNILDNFLGGKDVLVTTCHPYGTDPSDGTPNYYLLYPGMEAMKDALKTVCYNHGLPFIDIFETFKKKIVNRAGTLAGGQGGLWYTHDGQHQNELGMRLFWDTIKNVIKDVAPV